MSYKSYDQINYLAVYELDFEYVTLTDAGLTPNHRSSIYGDYGNLLGARPSVENLHKVMTALGAKHMF